nr:right-handed parallel beta-helix repeat-containing protein [uncultured Roseateles sp.]
MTDRSNKDDGMKDSALNPQRRLALQGAAAAASWLALPAGFCATQAQTQPRATLKVGPKREIRSLSAASREAKDGMVIEVDAGEYLGDVAAWSQNGITLKAVGGRVVLRAAGMSMQNKGIFVTTGRDISIEGFDFFGAVVPDQNGAGIRLEAGSLKLRDCTFKDNENGVLTSNDNSVRLEVENCEFGTIVRHQGKNHNIYVGAIAYFRAEGCYFHHGQAGHLLKSRAAINHIFYNRLTDEIGGQSSYELEFPNGGQCLVVGNVIAQSASSENPHMISFGAEGTTWPRQELHLINNTVVDGRPSGGIFLRVSPAQGPGQVKVRIFNNLWVGNPKLPEQADWQQGGNLAVDYDVFVQANRDNYLLKPGAKVRGKAVDPGEVDGLSLRPIAQFLAPRGTLKLTAPATHPGAFQFP